MLCHHFKFEFEFRMSWFQFKFASEELVCHRIYLQPCTSSNLSLFNLIYVVLYEHYVPSSYVIQIFVVGSKEDWKHWIGTNLNDGMKCFWYVSWKRRIMAQQSDSTTGILRRLKTSTPTTILQLEMDFTVTEIANNSLLLDTKPTAILFTDSRKQKTCRWGRNILRYPTLICL